MAEKTIEAMIFNETFAGWVGGVGSIQFIVVHYFQYPSNIVFFFQKKMSCL